MPTFRDFLDADLSTFLNPIEFGDLHDVDGKEILAVIDEDLSQTRSRQPLELYNATPGIYVQRIIMFVRKSDLGYRPVSDQLMKIDGAIYKVANCSDQMGVLEITLEANQA